MLASIAPENREPEGGGLMFSRGFRSGTWMENGLKCSLNLLQPLREWLFLRSANFIRSNMSE